MKILKLMLSTLKVTPQARHPERVFLREGSAVLAETYHLGGDPSRKNTRSGWLLLG